MDIYTNKRTIVQYVELERKLDSIDYIKAFGELIRHYQGPCDYYILAQIIRRYDFTPSTVMYNVNGVKYNSLAYIGVMSTMDNSLKLNLAYMLIFKGNFKWNDTINPESSREISSLYIGANMLHKADVDKDPVILTLMNEDKGQSIYPKLIIYTYANKLYKYIDPCVGISLALEILNKEYLQYAASSGYMLDYFQINNILFNIRSCSSQIIESRLVDIFRSYINYGLQIDIYQFDLINSLKSEYHTTLIEEYNKPLWKKITNRSSKGCVPESFDMLLKDLGVRGNIPDIRTKLNNISNSDKDILINNYKLKRKYYLIGKFSSTIDFSRDELPEIHIENSLPDHLDIIDCDIIYYDECGKIYAIPSTEFSTILHTCSNPYTNNLLPEYIMLKIKCSCSDDPYLTYSDVLDKLDEKDEPIDNKEFTRFILAEYCIKAKYIDMNNLVYNIHKYCYFPYANGMTFGHLMTSIAQYIRDNPNDKKFIKMVRSNVNRK
jgi:hypothetical protein